MHCRESERLRRLIAQEVLDDKEKKQDDPAYQPSGTLSLQNILFQKIPIPVRKMLEQNYKHLKRVNINNCDLRTFQNFPCLPHLLEVNAAKNSMRGSFEFIVKNRTITYMDVSDNVIADIKRFEPLRMLREISIYAKGNPFMTIKPSSMSNISGKESVAGKLKLYGVVLLKQAKKCEEVKEKEVEPKLEHLDSTKKESNGMRGCIKPSRFPDMRRGRGIEREAERNRETEERNRETERERGIYATISYEDSEDDGFFNELKEESLGRKFPIIKPLKKRLEDNNFQNPQNILKMIRMQNPQDEQSIMGGELRIMRVSMDGDMSVDSPKYQIEEDDDDDDDDDKLLDELEEDMQDMDDGMEEDIEIYGEGDSDDEEDNLPSL